jgi:opacity protein-like surface antigen
MKKTFLLAALAAALASCNKDTAPPDNAGDASGEKVIDASSPLLWHYFSFALDSIIGSQADDEGVVPAGNAQWSARTDWDFAVGFHQVRTNSGKSTTAGAQGGVYTMPSDVQYESIANVPAGAVFAADTDGTIVRMANPRTTAGVLARSDVQVFYFQLKPDFNTALDQQNTAALKMPPAYLPTPAYIFRSADGSRYYKLSFTNFSDADGTLGKEVRFKWAQITAP